jgi:hypothetical protein
MNEVIKVPTALVGVGESFRIENIGASGWVAVLYDRHGNPKFLSQADDPKTAVEMFVTRYGAAVAEIFSEGFKTMARGLEQVGEKMARAAIEMESFLKVTPPPASGE